MFWFCFHILVIDFFMILILLQKWVHWFLGHLGRSLRTTDYLHLRLRDIVAAFPSVICTTGHDLEFLLLLEGLEIIAELTAILGLHLVELILRILMGDLLTRRLSTDQVFGCTRILGKTSLKSAGILGRRNAAIIIWDHGVIALGDLRHTMLLKPRIFLRFTNLLNKPLIHIILLVRIEALGTIVTKWFQVWLLACVVIGCVIVVELVVVTHIK